MGWLSENADELAALMLVGAGIFLILAAGVSVVLLGKSLDIKEVLAVASTVFGSGTSYLFGKSQPKAKE
ncbi:hypothetical protein DRN93_03930 [archaeon]|nr:MAG: hypothetical protein DRN93_03930 [archaeon]